MKRLLAITIILLSIASCTFVNVSRTLNDVESYIMERPDSALTVLDSIDRVDLNTARTKAHHALLHAMALDKNFIDVSDDSIARVAVDYFSKHGPQKYHARSLYYLGLAYYYQEDYNKAIVEFTKAEEVAEACDSLYLGFVKVAQAEGRSDIESLMFKKVVTLIKEIKNDSTNRAKFEAMLDEDLDMIMTNLRKEMPKFSETDYSIFSYLVVGFDATTFSRLLDISVNNIYVHKHRIRTRIEERHPEHASQFLEMLA